MDKTNFGYSMRNIPLPDKVYQLELRQSRRFYEEDNVERNFVYKNEEQIEPTAWYIYIYIYIYVHVSII